MSELRLKIGNKVEIRLEPGDREDWERVKETVDAYYDSRGYDDN